MRIDLVGWWLNRRLKRWWLQHPVHDDLYWIAPRWGYIGQCAPFYSSPSLVNAVVYRLFHCPKARLVSR